MNLPVSAKSPTLTLRLLLALIKLYQWLTPWVPHTCRFYPSCSQYMAQALIAHGLLKGLWLGVNRLLRCHPWHSGGLDPVPDPPQAPH